MFRADLHCRREFSCGTTLTELLVAMIILGGGMITIAGMMNQSVFSLAHNMNQQRAARLGADLAEILSAIDANPSWPEVSPADYSCATYTCAPQELLAHTLANWHTRITRLLPSGHGTFQFAHSNGQDTIVIRLVWRTRGGNVTEFQTTIPVNRPVDAS
jgi:Tfp pilus assembly protein PilV